MSIARTKPLRGGNGREITQLNSETMTRNLYESLIDGPSAKVSETQGGKENKRRKEIGSETRA